MQFLDELLASKPKAAIFGSIVGGQFAELRKASALETAKRGVSGFVVEGLATGETILEQELLLTSVFKQLPKDKVRVVFGQGAPERVLQAVTAGGDIFDTVYPIELAERGVALAFWFGSTAEVLRGSTEDERNLELWSTAYERQLKPVVEQCPSLVHFLKIHVALYVHLDKDYFSQSVE